MRFSLPFRLFLVSVAAATIAQAQIAPVRSNLPLKPAPGVPAQPAPPAAAAAQNPVSLLDQPAKPAQIQFDSGKLLVKADNSTLSEILRDITSKTGMTVDGLSHDQRIFGSYGPGTPREVIASLMDGLRYNVVMVGSQSNGAPRQLLLSQRTGGVTTSSQTPAPAQNNGADDDDNNAPEPPDNAPLPPRPASSPEVNQPDQQPQQQQPAGQNGVKTPQQLLQELQDMRNRQLQQQQQQNPQ